jgi:hypothetical protein
MRFGLVLSLFAALFSTALLPKDASWNRIEFQCVIEGAAPTKESLLVLDEGQRREIDSLEHDTSTPQIITISNPQSLYKDAYSALDRRFRNDPATTRKILILSGSHGDMVPEVRRWELAFLALRRHVIIYGVGPSDATVKALAEETGGRVVPSIREFNADLKIMYRVIIRLPSSAVPMGAFHSLRLKVGCDPVQAAPLHYYVTPPWEK